MSFILLNDHPLSSDEQDYHALAASLANDGAYALHGVPTAYRPVGYPLFLAFIYWIAGPCPLAGKIAQALLDSALVFLLFVIGRRFSQSAASLSALAWAIFPLPILYSHLLLAETIFAFLLVVLCHILLSFRHGAKQSVLLGLVAGFLVLIKPSVIVFILFMAWYFFSSTHWKSSLVFLATMVLVGGPWVVRNSATIGQPVLSTNLGMNLFVGNNPLATGAYSSQFPDTLAAVASDEVSLDRLSRQLAAGYVLHHPHMIVVNGAKKMAHLLRSEGDALVLSFRSHQQSPLPSFLHSYHSVPLLAGFLVNAFSLVFLVTGLLGLMAIPRDPFFRFVFVLILSTLFVHAVFFGGSRFHFPLMPFLVLCACAVLPHLRESFKSLAPRLKLFFLTMTGLLLSLWAYEFLLVARS